MYKVNYESYVEIIDNVYWVGNHNSIPLHANPYLVGFGDEFIIFDPGGVNDFSVVTQKILNITDLNSIKYIVLHHEDPDICGMTHFLEEMIPTVKIIVNNNYSELFIKNYGIENPILNISKLNKFKIGGVEIEFIPTPFLHSPSSFMTYIKDYKILFSSDLFGWIGNNSRDIFSNSVGIENYILWHKSIVSSLDIFKPVINTVKSLDISIIASQHGGVIYGADRIDNILNILENTEYSYRNILLI
ncbi:MAG TPA: hypothetical protein PKW55_07315 [Spirochaetota bacterium]|nr:hypothetical protein [Spirochaetota bacterium]HOM38610.1 hypothetical protein [Spirochaetota bacterium]HPQ49747.1 hypothetical protein [Spirochaetota bacterium]